MKSFLAFFIFIAFFAQTFSKLLVIADYYSNTIAYAMNCENKAKPKLHCNGKCQMMKRLQHEEKKDQQNQSRKGGKDETLSSKSFFTAFEYFPNHTSIVYTDFHQVAIIDTPRTVFHPPGA